MAFKIPGLKSEEERKVEQVKHETEVAKVQAKAPISMQDDGDPKDAKGQTVGTMTQWMFTVSNQLAEQGNILREIRTLLQTSVLQVNRGKVSPAEKAAVEETFGKVEVKDLSPKKSEAELAKSAAEVLANNKGKNGKKPPVVDVPSIEVIAAQLSKYIKKHGKPAAETRLKQYKVEKASQLTDEQKALFLQDIAT